MRIAYLIKNVFWIMRPERSAAVSVSASRYRIEIRGRAYSGASSRAKARR